MAWGKEKKGMVVVFYNVTVLKYTSGGYTPRHDMTGKWQWIS
jgi:hypothetical protein